VKNDRQDQSADHLAIALGRASGLLSTLRDLYDAERSGFVGGDAFVVQGVTTALELVNEAERALAELESKWEAPVATPPAHQKTREVIDLASETPTASITPQPKTHHSTHIASIVETLKEAGGPREQFKPRYPEFADRISKVDLNGTHARDSLPLLSERPAVMSPIRKAMQQSTSMP
jgi:hypothetical protein